MTPFQFDHEFRARAPAVLFEAYFDAEQAAEQDALTGIERREVLERVEDDATLRRVCRVVPRRQLPALVRPFVAGELSYREALVWTKAADRMELTIEPSLLGGRTEITSRYEVTAGPPGACGDATRAR